MRPIKFRAWDADSKSMMDHGFFVDSRGPVFRETNKGQLVRWNAVVLMQFTGLLDKAGREIYEGDVVRYSIEGTAQRTPRVVEWEQTGWAGLNQDIDPYYRVDLSSLEVIGNIHENPELLSGYAARGQSDQVSEPKQARLTGGLR